MKEYLNIVKPYLNDIITNLQKSGTWKVESTTAVNFISSKNNDEEQVMHSKSDNTEVMTYDNGNEVIEEIFESLLPGCQVGLETSVKSSDLTFDGIV